MIGQFVLKNARDHRHATAAAVPELRLGPSNWHHCGHTLPVSSISASELIALWKPRRVPGAPISKSEPHRPQGIRARADDVGTRPVESDTALVPVRSCRRVLMVTWEKPIRLRTLAAENGQALAVVAT